MIPLQELLEYIDFENFLYAVIGSIAYIFFNVKGYPYPRQMETPAGEFDIHYSKVAHQTVTDALQGLVVVGEALFFIPLPRILSFWFPHFQSYRILTAFWCYFFSLSLAGITYSFFKGYVGRPRPDTVDQSGGDLSTCQEIASNSQFSSFPSGHAASTMSCAVFLALFLISSTNRPTHLMTIIAFAIWMFTFFIGCSRIVDHRHHPSDVVAGWVVGAILSLITWYASKDQIFAVPELGIVGPTLAHSIRQFLNPKVQMVLESR
jgi:membrane-associated phospholipid phosphatase